MQDFTIYRAHPPAPGRWRGILSTTTSTGRQTREVQGLAQGRQGPEWNHGDSSLGGPQAQMASAPSAGWVFLLMMSFGHCRLQQPSSIAGSMQPSKSPRVSCQRLLIHLPDPRPPLGYVLRLGGSGDGGVFVCLWGGRGFLALLPGQELQPWDDSLFSGSPHNLLLSVSSYFLISKLGPQCPDRTVSTSWD